MAHLTQNDVEAELSYAYLHAIAAAANIGCSVSDRHQDNAGVDAEICARDQFDDDSILTDITVHVQLKATSQKMVARDGKYSYALNTKQYNKLRRVTTVPYRILVVLFLPAGVKEWLQHSEEALLMKRCAYWVSLRGAPESQNSTSMTVHIPTRQVFSPEGLIELMVRISKQEDLLYEG